MKEVRTKFSRLPWHNHRSEHEPIISGAGGGRGRPLQALVEVQPDPHQSGHSPQGRPRPPCSSLHEENLIWPVELSG